MEITLLADHPNEVKTIARWYYKEWACHASNVTEKMVLEDITRKSANRNNIPLAIIARKDSELVGVAELKYRENQNYPEYEHWLGGLFVAPEHRGVGISNHLIIKVKDKADNLGITKLYLQCESHNVSLYQKHGFQVLHLANDDDESVVIMASETTT